MRIALDIDGCLAHFTRGYAEVIRKTSGRDLLTEEMILNPPCWNWDLAAGYTKEEERAAWNHIFSSNEFWQNLPPIPGLGQEFFDDLEALTYDHDVYFLTHRAGKNAKQQTEAWLFDRTLTCPTVLLSGDKLPLLKALDIQYFVDDKPETLATVAESRWAHKGKLFKVNYTYNADSPGVGVASVKEMLGVLGI
jgi:hypothetical protein